MPVYDYQALNEKGVIVKGVVDANTPKEAREKLRARKIHVTKMATARRTKKVAAPAESGFELKLPSLRSAPGRNDVPMVTRQLATLLKAGIPLSDAINALIEQIENRHLERAYRMIKEDISSGVTTTEAFARHPHLGPVLPALGFTNGILLTGTLTAFGFLSRRRSAVLRNLIPPKSLNPPFASPSAAASASAGASTSRSTGTAACSSATPCVSRTRSAASGRRPPPSGT